MNKLERLQAILTVLKSKRVVKAEELATRFEVTVRTIYRDIRSLEEAGIPIGAEAGIGYFIDPDYFIPPVRFTQEEAMAMLLAGKLMEVRSDFSSSKAFERAVTKIKSVLDEEKKDQWEKVEQQILICSPSPVSTEKNLFLSPINQALSESKVLHIQYQSNQGEITQREVEPLGITFQYQRWHLIAYCRMRKDYRDFRLDRIQELNLRTERFQKFKHPSLQTYLAGLLEKFELTEVQVLMSDTIQPFIQASKYNMGMLSETRQEEGILQVYAIPSLPYFASWLMSLGVHARVIQPASLRDMILSSLHATLHLYNQHTNGTPQ
ncbi:MAG: YafY family transcriptional regulator [Cytophagaceae bacterium]|jgi:predicted DNA-binding transcriptional regulator YafY|nr:YafY family transcriptional regulator [Cytophagaceae bacterium]